MRSESTLRRWARNLRRQIHASKDPTETRIAYAMQTVLLAALSKHGGHAGYEPVADSIQVAYLLREDLAR